jgi:hypothetical protein
MLTFDLLNNSPFMKKYFVRLSIILFIAFSAACSKTTVVTKKPLPPGQAKKITGTQSAKPYAPGQQKKQSTTPSKATPAKKKN